MKLLDMSFEELQETLKQMGQPKYRAVQIAEWCHKGRQIAEMSNLPKALRGQLEEIGLGGVTIAQEHRSFDGSKKYLLSLSDGNAVEGVLMQYQHGSSLCISTQVGCNMGCAFCSSGAEGMLRNLTAGEMASQIYAVARNNPEQRPNHCVLMGCGEPLDNYEAVVRFLRLISDERMYGMSLRNISLSTCGLVEKIDALSKEGLPITLCISLHAPDDQTRNKIMPISRRYAIEEVVGAAKRYETVTGRRVIFEYTLIDGINDSVDQAKKLARLTRHIRKHINLIPLNPGQGLFSPPPREKMQLFVKALEEEHVSVTLRRTLGADVAGACGQLRRRRMEETTTLGK